MELQSAAMTRRQIVDDSHEKETEEDWFAEFVCGLWSY